MNSSFINDIAKYIAAKESIKIDLTQQSIENKDNLEGILVCIDEKEIYWDYELLDKLNYDYLSDTSRIINFYPVGTPAFISYVLIPGIKLCKEIINFEFKVSNEKLDIREGDAVFIDPVTLTRLYNEQSNTALKLKKSQKIITGGVGLPNFFVDFFDSNIIELFGLSEMPYPLFYKDINKESDHFQLAKNVHLWPMKQELLKDKVSLPSGDIFLRDKGLYTFKGNVNKKVMGKTLFELENFLGKYMPIDINYMVEFNDREIQIYISLPHKKLEEMITQFVWENYSVPIEISICDNIKSNVYNKYFIKT